MEPHNAAAALASTPNSGHPASSASTRPQPRPQSASPAVSRQRTLRIPADGHSSNPSAATRRIYTKPRPPSASTALRRPRPQAASNQLSHSSHADAISPLIMREEIESQRRITRRAQRECNALRVQITTKQQEIAQLGRHLRPFDVETLDRAATPTATSIEQLQLESRRLDAYKKTLRCMLDRLARHLQFLRANAELLESQRVAAAREATLLQDKVAQERSLCAELELQRAQLIDERLAHRQHASQLLASLRTEIQSRARVSQQRQEADRRREEMLRLVESRPAEAAATSPEEHSLARPPFSGPPPLQKRGSQGRCDSFKLLMHESLQFFEASSRSGSLDGVPETASVASVAAMTVAASSRRLQAIRSHSAAESLAAAMRRETFYQVYETQYERILQETRESDLAIVLERFRGFAETSQRLQQIEKDLAVEDAALERKRVLLSEQLQQLRLSGIAEVEKRKKIRDFLEQQLLLKAAQRTQAEEAFVHQLKTFSYVQQGILNITELLKCLEERFSPPVLCSGTVPGSPASSLRHRSVRTPSARAEIDWLQSLLFACRHALRSSSSSSFPTEFSREQIVLLGKIDPTLGLAADEWAVERLKHSIVGGNVTLRADGVVEERDCNSQNGSEEDENEDQDQEDDEVENRETIKQHERETLAQAELLLRTLDSRQQLVRHERSLQHMRRAFGLGTVGEHDQEKEQEHKTDPAAEQAAKLAVVHTFFREKKLREKHEQQEKRAVIAALGGMMAATARRQPSAPPNHSANGAAAMAAIMAEMRAGPAHQHSSSGVRPREPSAERPPRKRSNGVTFSLPMAALIQQTGDAHKRPPPPHAMAPTLAVPHRQDQHPPPKR